MLRNCFWHPFTLQDTNRTMISHFRFWLTVHWLVFHDNNTQSATCIWPSSSSNSHSRHQRASWRKLSRTLSWRTNGARLCGQNVQRPRDSWVTLSRVFGSRNLNKTFYFSDRTWPTSNASSSASSSAPRTEWLNPSTRNWSEQPPRTEHSTASPSRERNLCQQRNQKLSRRRRS